MAKITKRTWSSASGEKREAWVFDYVDQHGKRAKKQFAKKRDAEAFRLEIEPQISKGTFVADAAKRTVADACDAYVKKLEAEAKANVVTEHYHRTTKAQLYNYVSPHSDSAKKHRENAEKHSARQSEKKWADTGKDIGSIRLAQCTRKVVNQFRDDLLTFGVKIVTTRRILGSLSRALANAVDDEWMAANPAADIEVKAPRNERGKNKEKVTPPSKGDLSLVMGLATGSLAMRIRLSASTGVRASELYELRWRDVSFNGGILTVSRRVAAEKGRQVDVPKSEAGKRTISLSAQMLGELRAWREKAEKKEADDLIFPNARGGHIDHRNMLEREFKPLLVLAVAKATEGNIKFKPFNWHALRHFAISTWIMAGGMQPKEVQTLAGHSSLQVTYDRYGHMFPSESHRNVMDKIASDIFA